MCDLGTVLGLGIVFANYNSVLIAFGIATAIVMVSLPKSLRFVIRHIGHPVSEPEVKYIFLLLFGLGALATAAKSEAGRPRTCSGSVQLVSSMPTPRWWVAFAASRSPF